MGSAASSCQVKGQRMQFLIQSIAKAVRLNVPFVHFWLLNSKGCVCLPAKRITKIQREFLTFEHWSESDQLATFFVIFIK